MTVTTGWDLFEDLRTAQDEILRAASGRSWWPGWQFTSSATPVAWAPAVDISERKDAYLVAVELPGVGTKLKKGAAAATVESVKAASDVYAPVSGEVIEVNAKVGNEPALVNSAPTGEGWLFKLKIADATELSTLLDEQAYNATIA